MSIYYKDNQSHAYKKQSHHNTNKPLATDSFILPNPFDSHSAQRSKSPQRQSAFKEKEKINGMNAQIQLHQQFQNLDNISPKNGKSKSILKTLQPIKDRIEAKKSPPKNRVKQKLSFIVQLFEEEESVAEISSYNHMSDNDELDYSISTIQSNQRHKGKYPQKKTMNREKIVNQSKQFNKMQSNSKGHQVQREGDQFALQQKRKVEEKSRPKFLFYNLIKQESNLHHQQRNQQTNNEKLVKKEKKTMPIKMESKLPEYKYEKGVHQKGKDKKDRLKNKLGFIFDIFNKNQEIASVSYYSEKQSQKQSVEALPPQKDSPAAVENVFNYTENDFSQALPREQIKDEKVQKSKSPSKSQAQSNQFEDINIPAKSLEKIKKIDLDTSFANLREPVKNPSSNSRHSPNPSKSLEKIQLQMSLKGRNKERENLSITKSVDNKPKKTRYEDTEELQHLQMVSIQKKSQELSRCIKNSSMNNSSKKPSENGQQSRQEKLSKSRSQDSKFSVKMLQVSVKKSIQKQLEHPLKQQNIQSPSFMRIESKQQEEIAEPTVKKIFPIARNIADNRNSLFSKYMKIDYKQENHQSNSDVLDQQLPSLINNTDQLLRQRVNQEKNHQLKTDANTGQETSKISFKPVNKVEFNLEKSKRMRTEFIQPKQDLNEQQKKFLALLRKREEALLKRVKEQALNNNPSSLLRDFQQRTKQISNDTFEKLIAKQDNSLSKIPSNYFHAERRQKMSFNTQQYEPKSHFPTLNLSPQAKQPNFQTFYNNPIKRSSSKNIKYLSSKKKGFSEHLSSDSEKGKKFDDRMEEVKGFKRQPSKISYYNIKKLQKDSSLKERNNLNSKEKYERLKQLLEQI